MKTSLQRLVRWVKQSLHSHSRQRRGGFRPHPEELENRVLLTQYFVDHNIDEVDGNTSPGNLSLREAINLANSNPGLDSVTFRSATNNVPFVLSLGELLVSDLTLIQGNGAGQTVIDGDNHSRVFHIQGANADVSIDSLTISGGFANEGGGILNEATLRLRSVDVRWNTANTGGVGAGISHRGQFLGIERSSIRANRLVYGFGGGAYLAGPTIILNSTFSRNVAIEIYLGLRTGAIYNRSSLTMRNTTIADNDGGVYTANSGAAQTTIYNSILVNNPVRTNMLLPDFDLHGKTISSASSNNIIGDGQNLPANGVNENQIVGRTFPRSRIMSPVLTQSGGQTWVYELTPASIALDAGADAEALSIRGFPLSNDQRGVGFERFVGASVDIGAYELESKDDAYFYDSTTGDVSILNSERSLLGSGSPFGLHQVGRFSPDRDWEFRTGDFNGDNRLDILGILPTGEFYVGLHVYAGLEISYWGRQGAAHDWHTVLVADVNGDGRDDLMTLNEDYANWNRISTGTGFLQEFGRYVPAGEYQATDFNFDGRADLQRIDGFDSAPIAAGVLNRFMGGDLDGDGIADDAALQDNGGRWFEAYVNASGSYDLRYLGASWAMPTLWSGHLLGDLNGDGRDDIAALTPQGFWWVVDSATGQTSQWTTSPVSSHTPMGVGDFNSDGLDDILAFNSTTGAIQVFYSTGNAFMGSESYAFEELRGNQFLGIGTIARPGEFLVVTTQ
ncbi:MAG: VCBS repeat-containing protein [Planctomycetaceae bacterium]|nr:VCBS repeat-containing protein [Planctomycetaceae bacterium]